MNQAKQIYSEFALIPTDEDDSKKQLPPDEKLFLRKRYYVSALTFLGLVVNFILRINPSVCIVEMTSNKTVIIDNVTYIEPAEYNWTPPEKGLILSSFSWGFLFTPIGLYFVDRIGGATAFGYTILFTGCLTVLSPFFISAGMYVFLFARGFEGLSEGTTTVCMYAICAIWIPPNERSRLVNFMFLGIPGGTMISYFITGIISYMFGWKSVFYVTGAMALVWYTIWATTIADTPDKDKFITERERNYIKELNKECIESSDKVAHPWKSMLTSTAILAYLNERFVGTWSLSFLTYCLPLYIKDVHSLNIRDIGFFSAMPHFFAVCSIIGGSWLQDYIRARTSMSKTRFHKSFILFGQTVAVIVLVTAGTWVNFYGNMIAFCIFKIGFCVAEVSYYVLPVDLCPQHARLLGSLSMLVCAISYLLNPLAMGFMVQNHTTGEWSRYFLFLACFNVWGALIFAKFGSGELQPWAQMETNPEEQNNSLKPN